MENSKLSQIQTLRKISFTNLEQFCEDLNRNFAVIQNSPLFKGIPGDQGDPGDAGSPGVRGSQFFFVKLSNFTPNFPGELKSGSDITIDFINNKLTSFDSKQKLLKSIGATELVNGDVIVLTNSVMISYNSSSEIFVNTNIAFNEQSNIISSIEEKIDDIIDEKLENNIILNSLKNIFVDYQSIGKQYSDTDNTYVVRKLSLSKQSIGLSPYIPGKNNNIGVSNNLINHEYFGYSTNEMSDISKSGTLVLGSMPVYIDLFEKTLSSSTTSTYTTRYVPTVDSIPTLILLQDTYNNGLMFGHKSSKSLKYFGSIYKNENGYLCIKSDMGEIDSEYGLLQINFQNLLFNKNFQLTGDAFLKRNVEIYGELNQRFFRTSRYTDGSNKDTIEIGQIPFVENSRCFNTSDVQYFKPYAGKVFVADNEGKILKEYTIEKSEIDTVNETDLNEFTKFPDNEKTIVTSNYLAILFRKTVNMCQYIKRNYWRKDQYSTGEIPELKISGDITAGKDFVNDAIKTNVTAKSVEVCNDENIWSYINGSNTLQFTKFLEKVFVTDENGNVLQNYYIDKTTLNDNDLNNNNEITNVPNSNNSVVTGNFIQWLATKINNFMSYVDKTYWKKNDFTSGSIPEFNTNDINISGNLTTPQINASETNNSLTLGKNDSTKTEINGDITLSKYPNIILVTNSDGLIINNYSLETNFLDESELPEFNLLSTDRLTSQNKLVSSKHLNQIFIKINNLIEKIQTLSWNKDDFENDTIPGLGVTGYLKAADGVIVGSGMENATFLTDRVSNKTVINTGTTTINSNTIEFTKFANKVLVCGFDGRLLNTYEVETSEIDPNFFHVPNYGEKPQPLSFYPGSPQKFLTSNYFNAIQRAIYNIKVRLAEVQNDTDVSITVNNNLPVGSIIIWSAKSVEVIKQKNPDNWQYLFESDNLTPKGWVICDGRNIPGTSISTEDYTSVFLRGNTKNQTSLKSGGNDEITLEISHLPQHTHDIRNQANNVQLTFPHTHTYDDLTYSNYISPRIDILSVDTSGNQRRNLPFPSLTADGNWEYFDYNGIKNLKIKSYDESSNATIKFPTGFTSNGITNKSTSYQETVKTLPRYKEVFYILKYK